MPTPNYVIIGVHGLSPKPPKKEHSEAWALAICEGLRRNFNLTVAPERLGIRRFGRLHWTLALITPAHVPDAQHSPGIQANRSAAHT